MGIATPTSPETMTRLQTAEVLISALLPLAAQHVRHRYAVVGSSQYEMEEWKRCEIAIRGAQRFLGLKPEGVFIPEEDKKEMGHVTCGYCGKHEVLCEIDPDTGRAMWKGDDRCGDCLAEQDRALASDPEMRRAYFARG